MQPQNDKANPVLTLRETAYLSGKSIATIQRLARDGQLPGLVRLPGRRPMVMRQVIERWLAGESVAAA